MVNIDHKKRPNWLLTGMIFFAAGIHVFLYGRISSLYDSDKVSHIELTLREKVPVRRDIPRPRPVQRKIASVPDLTRLPVKPLPVPEVMPQKVKLAQVISPVAMSDFPDNPAIPNAPVVAVAKFDPGDFAPIAVSSSIYASKNEFFEMVRLRIESCKQYPRVAVHRQIEGRVVVRFTILVDGSVDNIGVLKKSGSQLLDNAAIAAVQKAAPFARPPTNLFDGAVSLELPIVFELA